MNVFEDTITKAESQLLTAEVTWLRGERERLLAALTEANDALGSTIELLKIMERHQGDRRKLMSELADHIESMGKDM